MAGFESGVRPVSLSVAKSRRTGALKSRKAAGILLAVLLVVSGLGLFLHQRNSVADGVDSARIAARKTAVVSVAKLFSFDYRTLSAALPDRTTLLTEDFSKEYSQLVSSKVAPAAKAGHITTRTEVATASVVSATEDSVDLLFFLNQTSASQGSMIPILTGSRVRVEMRKVSGRWLVAGVDPI